MPHFLVSKQLEVQSERTKELLVKLYVPWASSTLTNWLLFNLAVKVLCDNACKLEIVLITQR